MRKTEGVVVTEYAAWFRESYPDDPIEHSFRVSTTFAEDRWPGSDGWLYEWGWPVEPDEPLRVATEVIWRDYCIRRDLPLDTPYAVAHTGEWTGVELDIDKSPRENLLVAPEWWAKDFAAHIWLAFRRA